MKTIIPKSIHSQKVILPGSKSISHRMLILASLCEGTSIIRNLLDSEDIQWTRSALTSMGALIEDESHGLCRVTGFGGNPRPFDSPVFLGNSGTSMRLLAGVAALGNSDYILTGDKRLCERPMNELLAAFNQLGIFTGTMDGLGKPPIRIRGGDRTGGRVSLDCSRSSQYLSSLLMIGPFMDNGLEISLNGPPVSSPYIDLTLDAMKQFQVRSFQIQSDLYRVDGGQIYRPGTFSVEPDLSNAGYFWAVGAVTGKMITVCNINPDSVQGDLKQIRILERMGCRVQRGVNEIGVCGSELVGIEVDMSDTPDAVPAIAVVAAFARGITRITHIRHLREKECDRIHALASQLARMGIEVRQGDDFLEITGGHPHGAMIETFDDHRVAMAFSISGLVVPGMVIENENCVRKSFPDYWRIFDALQSESPT